VTPENVRKSFWSGRPRRIADQILPYVEAGMNLMAPADMSIWGGASPENSAAGHEALALLNRLVKERAKARSTV